MTSSAFCVTRTPLFVRTRLSKLTFVYTCALPRCHPWSPQSSRSSVNMRMIQSPPEPEKLGTGSKEGLKARLDAAFGELEETSSDSSGLSRKQYLFVCLATAVLGSPTLGLTGALFLPFSVVTEAPLLLAAGAGLFTAALIDLGRAALLSSDILQTGEFLGVAVYLSCFAILSALADTSVGDKSLASRTAGAQVRGINDEPEDRPDSDEKRRADIVGGALQDWDSRLHRKEADKRRDS